MNRVVIDLAVLRRNIRVIDRTMREHGATWTLVTKMLCGHEDTLAALPDLGVTTAADSRLENLDAVRNVAPGLERWYLRPPGVSAGDRVVELADVSICTELEVLRNLNAAAARAGCRHRAVIMVELGELREGVLPGALLSFFRASLRLPNIDIVGIGANIGCLSGTVPTIEQLSPLELYRRLLELEFDVRLPLLSAGSSVVLAALLQGNVPKEINHYRIGEAAFLGTDLLGGGTLHGLENAVTIEGEIIEIKEKNLAPLGEISADVSPFDNGALQGGEPGERGHRALVAIGQLDTEVSGLVPLDPGHSLVGATSDISVVNLGENGGGLRVGDNIAFRPDYSAVARAMSSKYMRRELVNTGPEEATGPDAMKMARAALSIS
jgi:ornithine racemase